MTPVIYGPDEEFYVGGSRVVREGTDVTLARRPESLSTRRSQRPNAWPPDGIEARVIDVYSIKPLDAETLVAAASETGAIVTAEDHRPEGGLGDAIAARSPRREAQSRMRKLAVYQLPARASPPNSFIKPHRRRRDRRAARELARTRCRRCWRYDWNQPVSTRNRLREIEALGQSVWLDNLDRQLLDDGELEPLIEEDGLSGVTSNPTIFEKSIGHSGRYDDSSATSPRRLATHRRSSSNSPTATCTMRPICCARLSSRPRRRRLRVVRAPASLARDADGSVAAAQNINARSIVRTC